MSFLKKIKYYKLRMNEDKMWLPSKVSNCSAAVKATLYETSAWLNIPESVASSQ